MFEFLCTFVCDKYFAMSFSFKISLLYLLLIIPQYENNPLPVMEAWLQKDQDDGFVQRDMTSSLTGGDESFGSAHQNYQNSLIRKKKSDISGSPQSPAGYKKFNANRNQAYSQADLLFGGQYLNDNYNPKLLGGEKSDAIFDELEGEPEIPSSKYRSNTAFIKNQKEDNLNMRFLNKMKNDKYMDIVPSKDVMVYNRMTNMPLNQNLNAYNDDYGRNTKWSFCKKAKDKYSSNLPLSYLQSIPRENQGNMGNIMPGGYPVFDQEISENDAAYLNNEPEGKNPQIDTEYYDNEINPISDDDMMMAGEDYGQFISDHSFINKRDGTKQQERLSMISGFKAPPDTQRALFEAMKNRKYIDQPSFVQQMGISEMSNANLNPHSAINPDSAMTLNSAVNPEILWRLNPNFQSKALHDVVKNSQRALKEVQFYQQKHVLPSLKSSDINPNSNYKRESKNLPMLNLANTNVKFDEKRPKREDEDEQKNMKTGTDEGGGGEYEDEEGKGHKDEEEYYEDADLSNDGSSNDPQNTDDLNQKFVKREINKDVSLKNSEENQNEKSDDYEFNIENAPVENSGKSRHSSFLAEGEKTKKNSVRKGVKIWDQWGKWSPCSVTCGVGRSTRWRHCIGGGCAQGEKEAQIKRCTNPAC